MNVLKSELKLLLREWLVNQSFATDKLVASEEFLGRKDGFLEIELILDSVKNIGEFENKLNQLISSYQWQLKNHKIEDNLYSHEKIRVYLATVDYINKNKE